MGRYVLWASASYGPVRLMGRCVLWASASYGPVRLMGQEIRYSCDTDRIKFIYKHLAVTVAVCTEHCSSTEVRPFLDIKQQSEKRKITVSMFNS